MPAVLENQRRVSFQNIIMCPRCRGEGKAYNQREYNAYRRLITCPMCAGQLLIMTDIRRMMF